MPGAVKITRLDIPANELRKAAKLEDNPLVVRRALSIAMVLEGYDRKSAAEACGMDRQTLRDWVHRYNEHGLEGLRERRHNNHLSPLTPEASEAFAVLVEQGPNPAVHGVVRWRRVDLKRELEVRFGIQVQERTVGSYLAKLGYRRLSVRPQHPGADPEEQEAFKKTSPQSSRQHFRRKPLESPSKSGSRTKRGSASKAR